MPVNLSIRNVADETASRLRERAARNGRSTEAEIRAILDEAARSSPDVDWADLARRVAALSPPLDRDVTTDMIRQDRDSRR